MWLHHILLIVCLWWSLPCTFIGLEKLPFIQVLMALRKSFFKTYYRASGRCCWSAKTGVRKQKYGIEKKKLPISAQCLIDSRICVLRPCSQRTLYTFHCESRILGSRNAAKVAIMMHLTASECGQTQTKANCEWANHVGSVVLMFLWQWCRYENFSQRIFTSGSTGYKPTPKTKTRLHSPCHAKRLC